MAGIAVGAELVGRSVAAADTADRHRILAYRRFFGLEGDTPLLALHWLLFTALPERTRSDGHAAIMSPFPEMPYPRRMWAGGEVRWMRPLPEGATLDRHTEIATAELKHGGTGDFMLASLGHRISDDGGLLIDERQDIVFLQAGTRPGSAPPKPAPFEAVHRDERRFDAVDLFRYSALTLNSHRIHYDADYARDGEQYRGLVVHGPLLASTLMHAGQRWSDGRTPAAFRYRAVAPSNAGERLGVIGASGDDGLSLAVVGPEKDLRMTATMTFGDAP